MAKGYWLGCVTPDVFEVGRDPKFFDKGKGFAFAELVQGDLTKKFVHNVLGVTKMKPGDCVRLHCKNGMKHSGIPEAKQREIDEWKRRH